MQEEIGTFGESACVVFALGNCTFALSSKSGKTIDTMQRLDNESGVVDEIPLRTLAKNSASKLPELREDFAWFTTVGILSLNDSVASSADGVKEEAKQVGLGSQ